VCERSLRVISSSEVRVLGDVGLALMNVGPRAVSRSRNCLARFGMFLSIWPVAYARPQPPPQLFGAIKGHLLRHTVEQLGMDTLCKTPRRILHFRVTADMWVHYGLRW
jgi:hypothetical protein